MKLLPFPRSLKRQAGSYMLPAEGVLLLQGDLPRETVLLPVAERITEAAEAAGARLQFAVGLSRHPRLTIHALRDSAASEHPEGYRLKIDSGGVELRYRAEGGLRAGVATLRQLLREYGRRLPRLRIHDYPDFARRGVMLDVSRGRVPNLETLGELVGLLADFKINEFQLYVEHTFAYRDYEPVWRDWGPLTSEDIVKLDAWCRQLGIELVPNQNSFGHLRYWLEHPPLKRLAETSEPYEGAGGTFLRYPSTLACNHPGTLPFLRTLYDELLPNFTSPRFNVGCDETWDLGRGQTKDLCEKLGKGKVYLDFLLRIHREVSARGKTMMFWGDIILHHPELISELPGDVVALNWGYEANHPFSKETRLFAESKIPFYVCPGTSTWMTLVGRHDNAFANLRHAAEAGARHRAAGYLITDWGDGGHPQPLAVSYAPYLLGAGLAWCRRTCREDFLGPVLSRDVFQDDTGHAATAALALGFAHQRFGYYAPNVTPFGAVIAAPPPKWRELVCRDGLKYYARIPGKRIRAAAEEVLEQLTTLRRARPGNARGKMLVRELEMAARMAEQSCQIMLWQQALAAKQRSRARTIARASAKELRRLERDFNACWPLRNKGTTAKCSAFLGWRLEDFRRGVLHFPPEAAR